MVYLSLWSIFALPEVLKDYDITNRELMVMFALHINGASRQGQSRSSLHRFCETSHFCWGYRNFKKLMDALEGKHYISKNKVQYYLNDRGMLLVAQIERKLQKLNPELPKMQLKGS